jgi:S-DNA-T family DNA segregation ATPase FtsK/SpoIIIE
MIALSLSALEFGLLPLSLKRNNRNRSSQQESTVVSMKSIGSAKFQEAEMELPIALG